MKHTITYREEITLTLSHWGQHALEVVVEQDCAEAIGEPPPHAEPMRRGSQVKMPIWEALKVLGPLTPNSLRSPVRSIEIEVPEDPKVAAYRLDAMAAERHYEMCIETLREVTTALGIGSDYCAPEEIQRRASGFARREIERVPTYAGQWWYGDKVVTVEGDRQSLRVQRGNGRWTPVVKMADDWGGPALRDARVPAMDSGEGLAGDGPEDEDIPF